MSALTQDFCDRVIARACSRWGGLGTEGAEYIAKVSGDMDLVAYVRRIEQIAAMPDAFARAKAFRDAFDQDGQMILQAGAEQLKRDGSLEPAERIKIDHLLKLDKEGPEFFQP